MAVDEPFDVFVSYSAKDELIAGALVERLKREGIRYWWAPESLPPGISYQRSIARDIPRCRLVLVLLSDKSNRSHHVERELLIALDEGKPILPVRIEDVKPSEQLRYVLAGPHRMDAFPPFREHLDRIAATLVTWLETLRREAPVVRVLEPADHLTIVKDAPLRVSFIVLLGTERRLKRARLEIRRDGNLLAHRSLAESEINDHGGMQSVEWLLPATLPDGGHFQLAVLAVDTDGQEGSAQMEGSFAVDASAPAMEPEVVVVAMEREAVVEPTPASAPPSPASPPPDTKPEGQPSRRARAAESAFAAVIALGTWSFRLVWMLAIAGAVAGFAHQLAEPYTATQESHIYPRPQPVEIPALRPDSLFVTPHEGGSSAARMIREKTPGKAGGEANGNPAPPPPAPAPALSGNILEGLDRLTGTHTPPPLDNFYRIKGPRESGRPIMALLNTLKDPSKIGTYFHSAIPMPDGQKVSLMGAAWRGVVLGARLGLIAGVIAGLLSMVSALVQRLPLEMMPLGEEQHLMADFGILAIVVALTVFDTGAKLPATGRWTTPLCWWVGILTVFCFIGSNALKSSLNRKRQESMLG